MRVWHSAICEIRLVNLTALQACAVKLGLKTASSDVGCTSTHRPVLLCDDDFVVSEDSISRNLAEISSRQTYKTA